MKNKILLGFLSIFSLMLMPFVVSASDITGNIETINPLGNLVNFEKSYDSTNDVNNVNVVLKIDSSAIDTILSQKPGPGSGNVLGAYYLGLRLTDFAGVTVKKANAYYNRADGFSAIKSTLDSKVDGEDDSNDPTVWIFGVKVLYKNGNQWAPISDEGDGTVSIGQKLAEKVGREQSELTYGTDYIFYMYNNYNWGHIYKEQGGAGKTEYMSISYDVKFPITAVISNGTSELHQTLSSALSAAGLQQVDINENLTVTDIEIPTGAVIKVADGVSLTLGSNVINNGTIDGNVLYAVECTDCTSSVNGAKETDQVTITVTEKSGYSIKGIKVLKGEQEIETTNENGTYKFAMPAGAVKVSAIYEELPTYSIECTDCTSSVDGAKENEEVTITTSAKEGYIATGVKVLQGEQEVETIKNENGTYTFTMPAGVVKVSVVYEKIPTYLVECIDCTSSATNVKANEIVTITAKTKEGYVVKGVKVLQGEREVETIKNENGTYTFTMPIGAVKVSVVYEKEEVKTPDVEVETVDPTEEVDEVVIGVVDAEEVENILMDSLPEEYKNQDVDVKLSITEISDYISEYISEAIEEVLTEIGDGFVIDSYMNIDINIIKRGFIIDQISELTEKITLTVLLPEDVREVEDGYEKQYYMVRIHNGEIDVLDTVLSEDGKSLDFETDKFSIYALAYRLVKIENPQTLDSVMNFGILGLISLMSLIVMGMYVKKAKNN